MKQFIALVTLAMALVSNAQLRYVRDSATYANVGGNTRSAATLVELKPIAIVRSVFNGPTGDNPDFDFSYETENGIKQEATGTMKDIGGTEVMVMRGSYSYIDENGGEVLVSWVADEMGFRAESESLPIAPEIPFPDQAEAVAAQIRFAQEERARNANSGSSASRASYTSPNNEEPQEGRARDTNSRSSPLEASYISASNQEPQVFAARDSIAGYGFPTAAEPVVVAARAPSPLATYGGGFDIRNVAQADIPSRGIALVEVADPTVVIENRLSDYNQAEPGVQIVRDFETNNERVAPVQAKSRQQPDYIQYLLE